MADDDNLSEIQIGCFGDSTVGKTYLTRRYIKDPKIDYTLTTIGVEFLKTKRILSDGNKYKVTIYDTAGQERYRSLNSMRHCDGVILVYDITNRESFNSISTWMNNIYDIKEKDFPLILIGNKSDLKNQREVTTEEGLEAAEQYKIKFFETSAKERINVEQSLDELLNIMISKNLIKINKIKKSESIKLDKRKSTGKKKHNCCKK